jgi:aromatase
MTEQTQNTGPLTEVEHQILVQAPATEIYRLIAEVENWPLIFPPTVHVESLERGPGVERIQIWATANGAAKTWISRRELDPTAMRITFRQEKSQPPVAAMGGTWVIEPVSAQECVVRLLHDYRAVDDTPENQTWIEQAVDRNSRSELAALKVNAERAIRSAELLLSFEDTVTFSGAAQDAYDFINQAQLWSERLPHVARVDLQEPVPGLQWLAMDTRAKDGSTHTTTSVRVTFHPDKIVYKQVQLPALMTLHTGRWSFVEAADGTVTVNSQHTVAINESNIAKILGDDAGLEEAKAYVQSALSTNSLATLGHAQRYAQARS